MEFILSATVLFLILVGTLDLGRAFYFAVGLEAATREGARQGTWFLDSDPDSLYGSNPYLCYDNTLHYDSSKAISFANPYCIKQVVDAVLIKSGLPNSVLERGCPQPSDGNGYADPPYQDSAYQGAGPGTPILFVCFPQIAGQAYDSSPPPVDCHDAIKGQDLNVILLLNYPFVSGYSGFPATTHIAANTHMNVEGWVVAPCPSS